MTTAIIRPSESAHFYTRTGEPAYNATLREARKSNLYPSITGIIGMCAKPELTAWLQNQVLMSAATLPLVAGETTDAWCKRVKADAEAQSQKAREFGTRIHTLCENICMSIRDNTDCPFKIAEAEDLMFVDGFWGWAHGNISEVLAVEKCVANSELGYGGRMDLKAKLKDGRIGLIDLKTQGIKEGKPHAVYPEWLWQLVALDEADDVPKADVLISLIINSNKPEPVIVHEWPTTEYDRAWDAFEACLTLWKIKKKFDPVGR